MHSAWRLTLLLAISCSLPGMLEAQDLFDLPGVEGQSYCDISKVTIRNPCDSEEQRASSDGARRGAILGQQGLSLAFDGSSGQAVPSLSVTFVRYRLQLYEWRNKTRLFLPFAIINRVSGTYGSDGVATRADITSFAGAPATFRVSPNATISVGRSNSLTLGVVADARGVVRQVSGDGAAVQLSGYFALGLRYSGPGDVRTPDGLSYGGAYALSVVRYFVSAPRGIEAAGGVKPEDGDVTPALGHGAIGGLPLRSAPPRG